MQLLYSGAQHSGPDALPRGWRVPLPRSAFAFVFVFSSASACPCLWRLACSQDRRYPYGLPLAASELGIDDTLGPGVCRSTVALLTRQEKLPVWVGRQELEWLRVLRRCALRWGVAA